MNECPNVVISERNSGLTASTEPWRNRCPSAGWKRRSREWASGCQSSL